MIYRAEWTEILNSQITKFYPPSFASVPAGYKKGTIFSAWNSAGVDPGRRRMYLFDPGGHTDWYPNTAWMIEVSPSLDTAGWQLLSDCSLYLPEFAGGPNGGAVPPHDASPSVPSVEVYSDKKPPSRHNYDAVSFTPIQNEIWTVGGSRWRDSGVDTRVWRMPINQGPTQYTYVPGAPGFNLPVHGTQTVTYDEQENRTWMRDRTHLAWYSHDTNTWGRHSAQQPVHSAQRISSIDPRLRYFYTFRRGTTFVDRFSLAADAVNQHPEAIALTGDLSAFEPTGPGWEYLSEINKFVVYGGGGDVTLMDSVTGACTVVTGTGAAVPGVGFGSSKGIYGRFAAVGPNEILAAPDGNTNMWQLRVWESTSPTQIQMPGALTIGD